MQQSSRERESMRSDVAALMAAEYVVIWRPRLEFTAPRRRCSQTIPLRPRTRGQVEEKRLISVPVVLSYLGLGYVDVSHPIKVKLGWHKFIILSRGASTILMHLAHAGLSSTASFYPAPADGGHDKADPDCLC